MRPVTLASGYTLSDFNALLAVRDTLIYHEAIVLGLKDGTVLAYTNAQWPFSVPPCDGSVALRTYAANDVGVDGLKLKLTSGQSSGGNDPTVSIEVDEESVTFTPNLNSASPSLIEGVPFLQAVRQRVLDGAVIERDRWFFDGFTPVGGMPMFYGYTSSIDKLSRTQAIMKAKGAPVLLNIMMPRNLYQPNCLYTVYSTSCGADPAAFVQHGLVGASPTLAFIPWSSSDTSFTLGKVFFESGPNVNRWASIRAADSTGLYLTYPLYYQPLAGDQFAAYPGCDRSYTGGCAFFGRQSAFKATPRVPVAELAL